MSLFVSGSENIMIFGLTLICFADTDPNPEINFDEYIIVSV